MTKKKKVIEDKCEECGGFRMGESIMHKNGCSECTTTTQIEEPFFQEVISFTVPEFRDFVFNVKDFCMYYRDTQQICPFIKADADPKRKFKHIFNFDAQNCMWLCSWFQRQDLPAIAKRVERVAPNERK